MVALSQPIGVFDSGVGGLTVLKALMQAMPQENFIYLGDTARLPYGTKGAETVTQYALQAARMLMAHDIKMLVVACNTATALALPSLQKLLPQLPCLGVIEPSAKKAAEISKNGRIAVISTEGTARSGAYVSAIKRHNSNAEVQLLGCNLLVGLVEEGWCDGAEVESVMRRYLAQLKPDYDTLVLGCTHFPMLTSTIRKQISPNVTIVDSAASTAEAVHKYLNLHGLKNASENVGCNRLFATDLPERFASLAQWFLGGVTKPEVTLLDLLPPDDLQHKIRGYREMIVATTKDQKQYQDFFKNKTVTLLGLGLLGRGVGDAAFLAQHCKKVYVTDNKTADELHVSLNALKEFSNIEYTLGGHDFKNFTDVDFVIKGAGVRLDNPYVAHAQHNGIPVYMSTALFAKLSHLRTLGVTGTRGKTTTTCMIADILKHAGKKVLLGGNIRGVSTLSLLPTAREYDVAVLELDSWQMQGFDDLQISPNISVFTTFYPDHMNYYDGDMARYFYDKASIFRHQKAGDALVTTAEITAHAGAERARYQGQWIVANALPESFALKTPGAHNLLNAGLAKAAALAAGVDEKTIDEALHDFEAVEGRLQYVGRWLDRTLYNDNNATTQDATLAALTAFPPQSVVLIFGGADKGLPIDAMMHYIAEHKIRCVLIKGTGSDRVLQKLPHLPQATTMAEAVSMAVELSKPQDNIILSPAFASFGAFKNEYDRNDQFMAEVQALLAAA